MAWPLDQPQKAPDYPLELSQPQKPVAESLLALQTALPDVDWPEVTALVLKQQEHDVL